MRFQTQSKRLYPHNQSGFTLIELFLIITMVALLALIAVPAMSSAKIPAKEMVCQNNFRQQTAGWVLYSADYNDKICKTGGMDSVSDDPTAALYRAGAANANWVLGSMTFVQAATNELFIKNGLLYPYVNDIKLYKCPADRRTADFPGNAGKPTLRSYSMNCWMNPIYSWSGDQAPDSNGNHGLRNFRKQLDITRPATTFLLIEENPGSINDGWFICDPTQTSSWIDIPGAFHNDGANLSFSDGHCEARKWTDKSLLQGGIPVNVVPQDPDRVDLHWLSGRSTY